MPGMLVQAIAASESGTCLDDLRELYEHAFPAQERAPLETHKVRLLAGSSRLWAAYANDCAVGFSLCTSLGTGAWLLEHLATEAESRGKGLGARLLARVRADLTERGSSVLYMEVEAPELGPSDLWGVRRLAWYRRQGAEVVADFDAYAMPNCLTGAPLNMKLLAMPLASPILPQESALCRDVLCLYEQVYNLGADDPLVRTVLRAMRC